MSIHITDRMTVRELVGRHPATRKVFERHGIDYCCGGGQTLAEAARVHSADLLALLAGLQEALASPPQRPADKQDWFAAGLAQLADHIVSAHHVYMKRALPRIRELLKKVLAAHGERHGAMLRQVQDQFDALEQEISAHLMKEERVLFPFIVELERSVQSDGRAKAGSGWVAAPIQQMQHEHEHAGSALEAIRHLTDNYALPDDACPTFAALYEELQAMEADLHEHIHLENNILFVRALAMAGG
jgi:regulator of cell morphogenesis and NO signaling